MMHGKQLESKFLAAVLGVAALGVTACVDGDLLISDDDDETGGDMVSTGAAEAEPDDATDTNDEGEGEGEGGGENSSGEPVDARFTLQLLHASDMEGNVDATEDAPRFSAVLNALRDQMPEQTLTLASGDLWIPGPFYASGAAVGEVSVESDVVRFGNAGELGSSPTAPRPGRPDVAMLSAMGFQASCFGNHEFDRGLGEIADILRSVDLDGDTVPDWRGASFPYLSSNLDFTGTALASLVVEDGLAAADIPSRIAHSTVITVDGETFGIVGATTPTLESISSSQNTVVRPVSDDTAELAAIIQERVDALVGTGINKVVLLAHMQQLSFERQLAGLLHDVDIIVGGGSNTILADDTDRLRAADVAVDTYPVMFRSTTDEPVALVNTDGEYRYVGRLVVTFDEAGVIDESSLDASINGAYATDDEGVTATTGTVNPVVDAIAGAVGDVILERDGTLFGAASVYLDGRRESVRSQETNLGNLTADANLAYARLLDATVEVSIKNGGGIRRDIGVVSVPAGGLEPPVFLPNAANPAAGKQARDISRLDVEAALAFNNELTLLTLTSAELKTVLEQAVSGWSATSTPGAFPQISGLRFSFDPARTAQAAIDDMGEISVTTPGERVLNAVVLSDNQCQRVIIEDGLPVEGEDVRIVTLSFLAEGGDTYPFDGDNLSAADRVDLIDADFSGFPLDAAGFAAPGSEQDAFAEYLATRFGRSTPFNLGESGPQSDVRVQNLSLRSDSVFDGCGTL